MNQEPYDLANCEFKLWCVNYTYHTITAETCIGAEASHGGYQVFTIRTPRGGPIRVLRHDEGRSYHEKEADAIRALYAFLSIEWERKKESLHSLHTTKENLRCQYPDIIDD